MTRTRRSQESPKPEIPSDDSEVEVVEEIEDSPEPPKEVKQKRGRGRPKGSNKVVATPLKAVKQSTEEDIRIDSLSDEFQVEALPSSADNELDDLEIIAVEEKADHEKFLRKRRGDSLDVTTKKPAKIASGNHISVSQLVSSIIRSESAEAEAEAKSDSESDQYVQSEQSDDEDDDAEEAGSVKNDLYDLARQDEYEEPDITWSPKSPEVIEIESDSDSELPSTTPKSHQKGSRSIIHLLANPSYKMSSDTIEDVNIDTVTVSDLVGTRDLEETYQFNFNVDLEYFLSFLHSDFAKDRRKVVFITGSALLPQHPLREQFRKKFNISEAVASLPNRYASHHSKMMINFYKGGEAEIVIMTCNLTQLDFGGLTQAVWRSGRLKNGKTGSKRGKRFRSDLLKYLGKYRLNVTNDLIKRIGGLDYSSVEVELVASAPGTYPVHDDLKSDETYGYLKFRQVLKRNHLLINDTKERHNILAQVTSIAYPYTSKKGNTASVFSHLLCPLMFENWEQLLEPGAESFENLQDELNFSPLIIFPRTRDIAASNFGFLSGSACHFKYTNNSVYAAQYEQNIKNYLCKWSTPGNVTGRERVTPHVKYYACDNGDNWETLKWVLVGSHNLSKQAWGYPLAKSKGSQIEVSSYELSVLIHNKSKPLVPVYGKDVEPEAKGLPVRFPFVVPPTPYGSMDKPWSAEVDCGNLRDRWGNQYHGSFL